MGPGRGISKMQQQKHPPSFSHFLRKWPYSREPADRRKRAWPASPYRRPRRCRCRPSERARSLAAGSASGCPRQAAEGPPSSFRARPPPAVPAAPRFPLTRTSGAASQHGASARSSACTRDEQRLQPRAAQSRPFRPSGSRYQRAWKGSPAPRRCRVPAAALPPPWPPANCRAGFCPPAGARGRLGTWGGRPRSLLSAAPRTYFPAGACVLIPGARRPSKSSCAAAAAFRCTARPLAGGGGAYRRRRRRTTFPTRGCVTGRHVPGQRGSAPSVPPERAGRETRVPPWGLLGTRHSPGRAAAPPWPGASFPDPGSAPHSGGHGRPRAFLGWRASAKPLPALSGKPGGWRVE